MDIFISVIEMRQECFFFYFEVRFQFVLLIFDAARHETKPTSARWG